MRFSAGQTIGDYQILEVIGAGGMGAVYKVQHLISQRVEAMKMVLPDLASSGELAERFIREIRLQARLSHPNIAALHNALLFDNQLLMVMEYVDGVTLSSRLRHGKIAMRISIEIALQVLAALHYAHSQRVTHRDIKPANILIAAGGMVKLLDFGIASSAVDPHLTSAGVALGSMYYMSPEQARGETADGRSDLYSVGILLYEMLSGYRPITGENSLEIMNAHVQQIPTALRVQEPLLPHLLEEAVMRAIEKDPSRRFQSASEFAEQLRAIQISTENVAGVDEAFHTPASPSHQRNLGVPRRESTSEITPATPSDAHPASIVFRREDLELVKRQLAVHIGPVARIVVDRAAKRARTLQQLYDVVASEIPAGKERLSFLSSRPR